MQFIERIQQRTTLITLDGAEYFDTIDAMSRQGAHGAALVRHMIARGVIARPVDYARLDDRATLAAMLDADPRLIADNAGSRGVRFRKRRTLTQAWR